MSDPQSRGSWVRRGRVPSRASSNRSSGIFDDHLHPGNAYASSHSLRPMESRFSLNEQFATTRRDYEFGDDDASTYQSSIWENPTAEDREEHEDTVVVLGNTQSRSHTATGKPANPVLLDRDSYEILCLPQSKALTSDDIFKAYHRLLEVLQPERQPQALASTAQAVLLQVQEAFQALLQRHPGVTPDYSDAQLLESTAFEIEDTSPEDGMGEVYPNSVTGEIGSSTDLGIRLDATGASRKSQALSSSNWTAPSPVDLQLSQSRTMVLPIVGKGVQRLVTSAEDFIHSRLLDSNPGDRRIACAAPTITIAGGAHGFLDEPYRLVHALTDRYHPPGPHIHGRRHLEQLIASRFLPMLTLKLRQEFASLDRNGLRRVMVPDTVVESEVSLLPEPAITTRIAHAVTLPDGGNPLEVEVCVTKYLPAQASPPLVGLALHRRIAGGTAFVAIDAGDWTLRPAEECLHYSKFSTLTKRFANTRDPFRSQPTVEVGYTFRSSGLGLRSGRGFTQPADKGVRGMDLTMRDDDSSGTWTMSAGATAETVAGYLRYGKDILSLIHAAPDIDTSNHKPGGFRAEVELGASQSWFSRPQGNYLALRALKRVGRHSKLGFEVGVSPSNLHLSLYWSRVGQRINIPFLLATKSSLTTELVFWATLLPFLGFGVAEIIARNRALIRSVKKKRPRISSAETPYDIGRRRREADELTAVLANGVEPRQRAERQAGGLVILSAKYSVRGAPSDEVADVTVAVGALVDRGELYIPKGLRKGYLLGFWDPAPAQEKVVLVRYLYRGREYSVEVAGTEELRLPRLDGEKGT